MTLIDDTVAEVDARSAVETTGRQLPVLPRRGESLPTAPRRAPVAVGLRGRNRWRRLAVRMLLGMLAFVVLLWGYERFATGLLHDQRQRHLSADFSTPRPTVSQGSAVGVLQIPKISLNEVVIEGDGTDELRGGPARRSGSAFPGAVGRTVILGHRQAYGAPFARLGELMPGDQIHLQGKQAPGVVYVVKSVMSGETTGADLPEPGISQSQLVLVTSQRGWFAGGRIVVFATARATLAAGTSSSLSLSPSDRGAPFGTDAIIANLALALGFVAAAALRPRLSSPLVCAVLTPIASVAVLHFLLLADSVLTATR